jgi:alpha-tubulin suppressor-like RCC1 family protein
MKRNIIRSCLAIVLVLGQLLSGVTLLPAPAALAALVPPPCAPACAWGANGYGQLGTGNFTGSNVPVSMTTVSTIVTVASHQQHSMALKSDGTVWAWGYNNVGQLGNGTISSSYTPPVQVLNLTGVIAIGVGNQHSVALKSDGTVWAWGYNNNGELGNGTRTNSSIPVQVPGLTGVRAIAIGHDHNLGLLSDGTLQAWGYNANGELGNGTTANALTPVSVGLSGVTAIAAGMNHSLAVLGDGTVRAWGYNFYGALGNGTQTSSNVPVPVSGLNSVIAVVGGDLHSLALKTDGTVWAWGYNATGQLGNGTLTNSTTPVQVPGLSGVVAIASGKGPHNLALKNDNSVWAWGSGAVGQLGNGTNANSRTPVPVSNLYGAVAIAAGYQHSYAFIDTVAPTASPTQSPAANAAGWNNSNVTVNWNWTDNAGGSGIDAANCTSSTTSSGEGTLTLTASCHDGAGNTGTASYTVKVDKTQPGIALASRAPAANANGWNNSDVTLIWNCTDSLSSVVAAQDSQTITGEGANLAAMGTCADRADNLATHTQTGIHIDRTPPNTTITALGGWNNVAVTIALNPGDALSGVSATYYRLDGAASQTGTSLSISADGIHTLEYWSVDAADNVEAAHTAQIKIDQTAPTINHTQAPPANTNGWNNTGVTVAFICADDLSGIASCTAPQIVTTEGSQQPVIGTAIDNAGNTATDPASVNIDETAPAISVAADRPANANGWYNAAVLVSFTCADSLSGIDVCPVAQTLLEGANQSVSGAAFDAAGNSAGAALSGLNVDQTAPTLSGAPTTAPNSNGWYNGDVTVAWTCADALSGIDGTCPADSLVMGEGSNLSVGATVADRAGNTTSAAVDNLRIDRTMPTAHPTPSPVANGAGWNNSDVTIAWNWTDGTGSGVDATSCTTTSVSAGEGTLTLNAACSDLAGNVGYASYTVQVDQTAPTLNPLVSPNPVPLNGTAIVTSGAADTGSGLASDSCGALDTSSAGTKSVTCTAIDNAGNTASALASYTVVDNSSTTYNFTGFFAPVDNPGPGPTYVFNQTNAGKAIPVRFSLNGYQGMNIFVAGYPASQAVNCSSASAIDTVEETVAVGNSSLSYDAATDRYSYIWKTDKTWTGTCRKLTVKLMDGTEHVAYFKFVR